MVSAAAPEPAKSGIQRTITGSRMDLSELESIISGANVRDRDIEASSVASSSHTGDRSNIIQIVPGKKNIKAAMRAALAEAQGYDDPDEPPVRSLEDLHLDGYDTGYDMSSPNTPKRNSQELKHDVLARHPTEPLEGAGAAPRVYTESSAPPEGAGGYQTGEFVPPVVEAKKPPARPRHEPVPNGLHRTITGSSLKLEELNQLLEKAGEQECPGTPSSAGGRTPHSHSGWSSASGSRAGSIVQIQPGVKDIRTALATAIAESQDSFSNHSPSEGGMHDRQSISERYSRGSISTPYSDANTPQDGGPSNPFGAAAQSGPAMHRPRSIRRLMSEKSLTMDTVYSGMVLDSEMPSEPLEGTGIVANRKYLEPKHGPQYVPEAPKDFPRVVNGVLTTSAGDEMELERSSIPPSPSPSMKPSGVHRTISGSQMDLSELAAIMEKAAVPKEERTSFDARSSAGGSTATHRTVKGSGRLSHSGSQVFGEEIADEPKATFGHRAASISKEEIQALIQKASVPRAEPDSPRSLSSHEA